MHVSLSPRHRISHSLPNPSIPTPQKRPVSTSVAPPCSRELYQRAPSPPAAPRLATLHPCLLTENENQEFSHSRLSPSPAARINQSINPNPPLTLAIRIQNSRLLHAPPSSTSSPHYAPERDNRSALTLRAACRARPPCPYRVLYARSLFRSPAMGRFVRSDGESGAAWIYCAYMSSWLVSIRIWVFSAQARSVPVVGLCAGWRGCVMHGAESGVMDWGNR